MARIDDTHATERRAAPRRSLLWRKRWLVLIGAAALVWFAPQIVAATLLQTVIDRAAPQLNGQAKVRSASLGWLSPVVLRDVVWRDADGKTLAEVRSVRVEKSLYQLLSDASDLGVVHVEQPRVSVALRDDGSNLEDALAPLLNAESAGPSPAFTLHVTDGVVEVVDGARQLAWQLEKLTATVTLPPSADDPSRVVVAGQIHDSQGTPRPLDLDFAWHAPRAQPQAGEPGGTLKLKTTDTPLAMLRPVVRRFVKEADLSGVASCDLSFTYNADHSRQQLHLAKLQGREILFAAPQWLGAEPLRSAAINASGDVELAGGKAQLRAVQLDSDFARVTAEGRVAIANLGSTPSAALAALQNDDYALHGELDLARLAALFPNTLRVREGTEITAGIVTLDLASTTQGKKRRWDGELKSSQLSATQNGREIVWDEPITVTLAAQQSSNGPVIERLACQSSFLALQARGTLDAGELTMNGDLAQLLAEANRFLDLDDMRLTGKLEGDMNWRRDGERDFQAQGGAQVTAFELIVPGQQPWQEPRLDVELAAEGIIADGALAQLTSARFRLIAGEDDCAAQLREPVDAPATATAWPLQVTARGELSRWLPRVQAWLPLTLERASGAAALSANVTSSAEQLALSDLQIDVQNLLVQAAGVSINEPEVQISGDAAFDRRQGQIASQSLTVATSAVALRADKLAMTPRDGAVGLSGEVGYRADLERLAAWFHPPGTPVELKWGGMTEGRLKFTHDSSVTQAKWTAEFTELSLARPRASSANPLLPVAVPTNDWETVWTEPKLAWHGQGSYEHATAKLTATHLNITSDMLNVTARGQIAALTTAPAVDLSGEIAYDLKNIAALLAPYVGEGLELSGADRRQFTLRGPLPSVVTFASQDPRHPAPTQKLVWPKELSGKAGIGWTAANIYDLPVGAASLDATLENGIINFAPLDVQVADGKVKAWPRIVLSNEPMVFQLAQGTQIDQVQITPQMCQTWLKFVAPLLADATRAEGKFSLAVGGATFPLVNPEQGDARGTLTVHGARVGPGPLAEQYVYLAHQVRTLLERRPLDPNFKSGSVEWLMLPQQDVKVEMNGGRVYHQGLQIVVRDTTLVTTGSVGVDQSLALLVEVPIRDEWIAKDRVLAGLRGQSLKVPITGTVGQPKLDDRALQQLAGQLINNAATGLIENKLQEGLEKLLRPK